ncbi:MAG: type II secretion system protein GspM [Pseudomonadota bacterium]
MKAWFDDLQPRERWVLMIGAVVLTLTLVYAFLLQPFNENYARAVNDIENKQQLLADSRRLLKPGNTASVQTPAGMTPTQSLTLVIANTVNANGLGRAYRSSTPTNDDGIRVSLQDAAFDDVVTWLGQLDRDDGIAVVSGNFSARADVGRVDASLVLQRR